MEEKELPSLLSCLQSDGSINVGAVISRLSKEEDEEALLMDELSILECFKLGRVFNLYRFLQRQKEISLFEMSLLYEADMMDNASTVVDQALKQQFKQRSRCSMLYKLWVGDDRVAAKPEDSTWYLMYIKCPMLNVLKFHVQFHQRFRMPYPQFIQFASDARNDNWFPHWNKWNSASPLELLLLVLFVT
jgi:hypothetical protein